MYVVERLLAKLDKRAMPKHQTALDLYRARNRPGAVDEVPTGLAAIDAVAVGTPVLAAPPVDARLAHITRMRDEGKMSQSAFDAAKSDIEMSTGWGTAAVFADRGDPGVSQSASATIPQGACKKSSARIHAAGALVGF